MSQHPIITPFVLGPHQTNCYVITSAERPGECWIADVGFEPALMLEHLEAKRLTPSAIVLTHAHPDHIAGVPSLRTQFGEVPVWIHEAESEWLVNPELNLSALMGFPISMAAPDALMTHGQELHLLDETWRVAHTPGHSPGGIALVHDASRQAIVGDALFQGSIGRTDFPGGSFETLAASIRDALYTLPDETKIYPGHGPSSTIGQEKATNPFVRP